MKSRLLYVLLSCIILLTQALSAQSWNQLLPSGGPPAARGFQGTTSVYDPASNRMIVFGGRGSSGANLNDVWVLTNANGLGGASQWLNLIPNGVPGSPPARSGHVAVYDAANNRMIIFGGCSGNCAPALNDTWVLANANGLGGTPVWTQLATLFPPAARVKPAAVYDQNHNHLIIFAGQDGSASECSTFSDVWVLNNANGLGDVPVWSSRTPFNGYVGSPPAGRYGATAILAPSSIASFVPGAEMMVVFGGIGLVNGTCQATNAVWAIPNVVDNIPYGAFEFWVPIVPESAPGSPVARSFHSAVYDSVGARMIIFGGRGNSTPALNDVWSLSTVGDQLWSALSPTGTPPSGRIAHAATFDSMGRRMTIFAGSNASGPLNDTWVLNAPGVSQLSCVANAGVPPLIRAEGITEKMGDLILNCSGGIPTPKGQPIPKYTINLSLNTDVTSRPLPSGASLSEAFLAIDEPVPASPAPSFVTFPPSSPPQILCKPQGSSCSETGTGGVPSPYSTQPNIFTAQQTGPHSLQWVGVPIDPPGVNSTRVIRITNVRANASELPLLISATQPPTSVQALVGISGAQQVPIANPQQVVAFILPGSVVAGSSSKLSQCVPHNPSLLGAVGTGAFDFSIGVSEWYAASFMLRDFAVTADGITASQLPEQNVFGFPYNTESTFYSPSLFMLTPEVGLADFGTRILLRFRPVSAGVHLFVPTSIPLNKSFPAFNGYATITNGLQLVRADQTGNSAPGFTPVAPTASVGITPVAEVSYNGSTAEAVYEVLNANPNNVEVAAIPVAVAFTSTSQSSPALGQVFVNASLAPLSLVETSDLAAPVPRFADPSVPQSAYSIQSCSATSLSGRIASKTGVQNARVWTIEVDNGATPAHSAEIDGFTFTQTFGAACTPMVANTFPLALGDVAAAGSATAPVTIDFTGCPNNARFTVNIPLSANGGAAIGDILRNNEYR